jgi:cytochrome P450
VADEVRDVGLPDAADLQVPAQLKFTEAVLRESLRLYPPTWVFERVALGPDRLPSGTPVEAGGRLYLCQWVMHRHPRFFPAPDAFEPERFLSASARPFRFVYFPFGDGAHTCIGEQFAMLEALVVVAAVSRRFRVELVPGPPVVPRARITLSPRNGIRVRIWRR